jgi:putative ABC transport system permease protein
MLKNYIKTAIRSLLKHKLYTAINIFGLATSLAICLVVLGHVSYELTFEDCHENRDRIYRVNGTYSSGDTLVYTSQVMPALGPAIAEEIPEIEKVAILRTLGNLDLKFGEQSFLDDGEYDRGGYEHDGNVLCANPDFLEVFTLPLVQGDPETVLTDPFSALITEEASRLFFRGENPVGQTVKINDDLICTITGILKDIPENTQIHSDFIVSYSSLERIGEDTRFWDHFGQDFIYLLIGDQTDPAVVEEKIPGIVKKYLEPETAEKYEFELQPLEDIYFGYYGSGRRGDLGPHGETSMIIEISIIAGFILLLAIANFINLSTARSADRIKEVGVRKVLGAFRMHLMKQFLGESILVTFGSVLVALVLYEIFKIWVTPLLPRETLADFYNNLYMVFLLIGLVLTVGVMAGFYPALYLSKFRPVAIFQQKSGIKSSRSILRRILVVFQFTIAVIFICTTLILYKQVQYVASADLGFEYENVLLLHFAGEDASKNCQLMKNEAVNNRHVLAATMTNAPPGQMTYTYRALYTDEQRQDRIVTRAYAADYDFFSTFGLEIIEGRQFSPEIDGDATGAIVISEAMVKKLEIENPIGYRFYGKDDFYEVIGVVREFVGTAQTFSDITSSIVMLDPERYKTLALKLPASDITGSRVAIKRLWEATLPGVPFDHSFLEDEVKNSYGDLRGTTRIFLVLSLLAISMACLGIFGLVGYTAEQKTKEIGIRKTLGASVSGVVTMLSRELAILIVIANVIACPLAFMISNDFLQYFALRVDIGFGIFIMTGIFGILLALGAASFQAIKAARANPVDALKCE